MYASFVPSDMIAVWWPSPVGVAGAGAAAVLVAAIAADVVPAPAGGVEGAGGPESEPPEPQAASSDAARTGSRRFTAPC